MTTRQRSNAGFKVSNSIIRTRYIIICQKPTMEKSHFFDPNNRYNILRLNSRNPMIAGGNERYKIQHTVQKYFHETRYNANIAAVYSSFPNNFTVFIPLTTYFFPPRRTRQPFSRKYHVAFHLTWKHRHSLG